MPVGNGGREGRRRVERGRPLQRVPDGQGASPGRGRDYGGTFLDCKSTCDLIVKYLGRTTLVDNLESQDFADLLADGEALGAGPIGQRDPAVRLVFLWAMKNKTRCLKRPVEFGSEFVKPSVRDPSAQGQAERRRTARRR